MADANRQLSIPSSHRNAVRALQATAHFAAATEAVSVARPHRSAAAAGAERLDPTCRPAVVFRCPSSVRLFAIGATDIAQTLAVAAGLAGFEVTVVDPRSAFATPERFPKTPIAAEWPETALPRLGVDCYTAVALLAHEPRIDDPALGAALRAQCFYIGALGSKITHARRLERMRTAGFSEAELAQIHSPIGLAIGAANPAEIGIAIVAEIIAVRRKGSAAVEKAA